MISLDFRSPEPFHGKDVMDLHQNSRKFGTPTPLGQRRGVLGRLRQFLVEVLSAPKVHGKPHCASEDYQLAVTSCSQKELAPMNEWLEITD
jgi:hypothetical protein